jgi:hypothetical protein
MPRILYMHTPPPLQTLFHVVIYLLVCVCVYLFTTHFFFIVIDGRVGGFMSPTFSSFFLISYSLRSPPPFGQIQLHDTAVL